MRSSLSLRLGAALVHVERGEDDEREQLEELRLPVLERRLGELAEEVTDAGVLAMGQLLIRVHLPLGDGVGDPRGEEQHHQPDAEPEVAPDRAARSPVRADAAHHRDDQEPQ